MTEDDDVFRPRMRVSARELLEMEEDRLAHERPNEPDRDPFDQCVESIYLTHSFSIADPRGHRCKYCNRRILDCLKVPPSWP